MSFLFINVNHEVGAEHSESIPLSLGYVLAALKADGWDGIILDDLKDRPLTFKSLELWINRMDPSLIGFTAYQSTMDRIRYLCRYIKSRHRRIRVILGGPQAAVMPSAGLEDLEDVDVLVRGDGEVVTPALVRALGNGEPLESVDGITCRSERGMVDTDRGPDPPDDLDAYASPYLTDLLNLDGKDTAILLSSRGCRHVCRFCITPSICKGKVRYHSVERTVAEMEHLGKAGIGRFWFADPTFTQDRDRTERLLQAKIDRGVVTPFWCQTRSDLVDEELLEKLSRAGADTVAFGLESGSPGVLAGTNKRIELKQLEENIRAARALGMDTELFSIFGLPGETVEDARRTLEFVRSLDIPIQSNSGSQQMQLYFGSIYSRNPERFGFKPKQAFRPRYFSIGDEYETEAMSAEQMRKVRNIWVLANERMERDVYMKQRTFEVIDYLLNNRADLAEEPAFYAYGALAGGSIEEFGLLTQFLEGYEKLQAGNGNSVKELISALSFFKESDEPAGPMDRIIFDSRSWIEGVPFTGISGKYWDVLLGRGLLLTTFEEAFNGAGANEEISFNFTFPDDYDQEELRGRQVEVQAKIRKVFKSVEVETLEDVRNLQIRNRYSFPDLDLLREQNEILYYLALRDTEPSELLNKPSHFLMLIRNLVKLGKRAPVDGMAEMLEGNPAALAAVADTLAAAGKCAWALQYYTEDPEDTARLVLKKARCLLNMQEPEQALDLVQSIPERGDPEFQETLLQCLKKARPDSERIPSLDHHVLDLRVDAALQRERVVKLGTASATPIVHGLPRRD